MTSNITNPESQALPPFLSRVARSRHGLVLVNALLDIVKENNLKPDKPTPYIGLVTSRLVAIIESAEFDWRAPREETITQLATNLIMLHSCLDTYVKFTRCSELLIIVTSAHPRVIVTTFGTLSNVVLNVLVNSADYPTLVTPVRRHLSLCTLLKLPTRYVELQG
jgi:hypothetical protein